MAFFFLLLLLLFFSGLKRLMPVTKFLFLLLWKSLPQHSSQKKDMYTYKKSILPPGTNNTFEVILPYCQGWWGSTLQFCTQAAIHITNCEPCTLTSVQNASFSTTCKNNVTTHSSVNHSPESNWCMHVLLNHKTNKQTNSRANAYRAGVRDTLSEH